MMNGIDISEHQKGINLKQINTDFIIIKATEGRTYTDPQCTNHLKQVLELGKPFGFYHYARPENNTPEQEVDNFLKVVSPYVGKAILILDWESVKKYDTAWAKKWLDLVYEKTHVKPIIYMSESVVNSYDWSAVAAGDYGLWVARYRDNVTDINYDKTNIGKKPTVKYWKFYCMWQWTSSGRLDNYAGNLDCDEFYGDKDTWAAYAKAQQTAQESIADEKPDNSSRAKEIMAQISALLDELNKLI